MNVITVDDVILCKIAASIFVCSADSTSCPRCTLAQAVTTTHNEGCRGVGGGAGLEYQAAQVRKRFYAARPSED